MSAKIENSNGIISISNDVLANIAGEAASSCYGVVGMAVRNKADGIASLLKRDNATKGIKIIEEGDGIGVEIHIIVEYGVNIRTISDSIISCVKYKIESITGFNIKYVNVNIESIRVSVE